MDPLPTCAECKRTMIRSIFEGPSGFFIGTACMKHGVWDRESIYYGSRELALEYFKDGSWTKRDRTEH